MDVLHLYCGNQNLMCMKKAILLVALIIATTTFAQTEKGWRSVGGSGRIGMSFENPAFNFNLSPELYWFVANNFALGTDFGFGFNTLKPTDSTSFGNSDVFATLGARYYFRDTEVKWRPYAFLNGGYEFYASTSKIGSTSNSSSGRGFRGYGGAGIAWFFNQNAAFDLRLHAIDYTRQDIYFNPSFTIGVHAFFD